VEKAKTLTKLLFILLFCVAINFLKINIAFANIGTFDIRNGKVSEFRLDNPIEENNDGDEGFVYLNGTPAIISSWGTGGIHVQVPPSVSGFVDVKVVSASGIEYQIKNDFFISPIVTSCTDEVKLGEGTIEIIGRGFSRYPFENKNQWVINVSSSERELEITSWSDNKIEVFATNNGALLKGINSLQVIYGESRNRAFKSDTFDVNVISGCTEDSWDCTDWTECLVDSNWMHNNSSYNGFRERNCIKTFDCPRVEGTPEMHQQCTPQPVITSISPSKISVHDQVTIHGYNFGPFGYSGNYCPTCQIKVNGTNASSYSWQYDWTNTSITFTMPQKATSGSITVVDKNGNESNKFNFTLTPSCTEDTWECGDWGTCSSYGTQRRSCTKTYDCPGVYTSSPPTTQYCEYIPQCTSDTWSCGSWGLCSPSGIQTRNCNRIYDCPSVETASPATSQYCEAPNKPKYQTPPDDSEIINQSSIIKATVKLICPVSRTMASQGSGTVINSDGTILTNKHVVNGTVGCLVGFIDNYNDEPYFADRHIADIDSISSNADIAVLKLRNPYRRKLTAINIAGNNSNNLSLGNRITTYGYPAKFGTKITYTSGDFSGVDGNYLKTTAVIEYGNSGGGAYLRNGTFIGIPTAVMKGELNSLGYVLSVNKINSWLNGSPMAYNYNNNNSYARVSILEDIDLSTLDSLGLFIYEENQNSQSNQQQNTNNYSNGSLLRAKNTAGIYLIENGDKRPIKSAKIFLGKGYKWGDVIEVSQSEMNSYPLGTDLTIDENNENKETPSEQKSAGTLSNGALARAKGTHGVYLIHNNQKRPIKSAKIFLGRGYKWGNVVDIEQSVLDTYPLGENVTLSESITTENETQIITINVPKLRVRSLPSLEGKIITLVSEGQEYPILAEQNGWYQINYETGKTGWVMGKYTIKK